MNSRIEVQPRSNAVCIEGAGKAAVETAWRRIFTVAGVFVLCFGVLASRLVDLALVRGGDQVAGGGTAVVRPHAPRATIVDRAGELVAANLRTASLYADARKIADPDLAATKLVRIIPDLDLASLKQKLASNRAFIWLKRNLTPEQQVEVNRLGLPGLAFRRNSKRTYPHGALLAHVLGYTDVDNRGISGIEKWFDAELNDPGRQEGALELALDIRVQHALRQELATTMERHGAKGAAGVLMDASNGEILAMASLPDFDPNKIDADDKDALFNRATLGVYEMGSTFKVFTTAMALESGRVRLADSYDATEPIRISRFRIRDYHAKRRPLTVPEILVYSSNIGAARMAMDIGPAGQRQFLSRLGLLDRPQVELPEIGEPMLPRRWAKVETMTISYGHGISVSLLQLAGATAALVNGGFKVRDTLVRRRPGDLGPRQRVIAPATSDTMRRLLRLVVTDGTGGQAAAPGYMVGGKTGTAEKAAGGSYDRKALLTTFVAAFPMQDPKYVIAVLIDEPHGIAETHGFATAGWTAAPTVARVVGRAAPLLGVAAVDEDEPGLVRAMDMPSFRKVRKLAAF